VEIHESLSREKKLHLTRTAWAKPGKTLVKVVKVKLKQGQTEEKLVEIYVQKCFQPLNNSRHSMEHFNKRSNFSYKHNRVISKYGTQNITQDTV